MDRDAMFLAAHGAFMFGAVALLGLMAGGLMINPFSFKCGLVAAACSYLAQIAEAYGQASGSKIISVAVFVFWAAALGCFAVGFISIMGA